MRRFLSLFLLTLLLLPQGIALAQSADQQTVPDSQVEALLAKMGPEDRVGQLCLVTFYGSDVSETSDIADLITRYHIGGVVLLKENDNLSDVEDLPYQVYHLTTALQRLAASPARSAPSGAPYSSGIPGPYIPLFVGIEHDGTGWPHDQLFSGVTPLPSSMALGATWDPSLAEAVGQVVGEELPALGINLLLGPSVDVVESPPPSASGDLGTWVFGGQPFWVSQIATAYVRGVHEGSDSRLAVVPRHFPGYGGADRLASVEVPMVRKSLDELKLFDLIPFFALTSASRDSLDVADALMTGHISYLGFQGDNPLAATRPISLDNRALQELLKLEPLATWRAQGGLIVSDALGLRGIRRLYDPQEEIFAGRRIAQDALMAGNDVLYLGQFGKNPQIDQKATIVDTINFFVQAYQTDAAFQTRVDDAVRRILRKKLELYGGRFDLQGTVLPASAGLSTLGIQAHSDVTFNVAQSSLTLLSPSRPDLLTSPQSGERIVVFTDTRTVKQCTNCAAHPLIPVDALQSAILRLYGPRASKLVTPADIQSYSFDQLANYLEFGPQTVSTEGATAVPDNLSLALNSADWVVFLMLDTDPSIPSSGAVKRFLAVSPVGPNTRVVVMAMAAPYHLDMTEVGKLTAYYGLYSHTEQSVDIAARALFLGARPAGASPVSVAGVNYTIVQATSPDPNQIIKLSYGGGQASDTPTPVPVLKRGDVLQVSTGVIVDHNGHLVPDGTPVDFKLSYKSEGLTNTDTVSSTTLSGVAQAPPQPLDKIGELSIQAASGLATQSDTVVVFIRETGEVSITVSRPDVPPTRTPSPTVTPTPEPVVTATPPPKREAPIVNFGDLLMSLFGLAALGLAVFVFGISRHDLNYGLLLSLPTVVMGLASYNYYALYMPGAGSWRKLMGDFWGAGVFTWLGALVGLVLAILVLYTVSRIPRSPSGKRARY